jgi:hypothetical protein
MGYSSILHFRQLKWTEELGAEFGNYVDGNEEEEN